MSGPEGMGWEALCTMLGMRSLCGWRYTRSDAAALDRDCKTVMLCAGQKVGAERVSAKGAGGVSAAEYDGAVARILANACCLCMSGQLARVSDEDEGEDEE